MAVDQRTGPDDRSAAGGAPGAAGRRILVVANETIGGRALLDEIERRAGEKSVVHVVAPALVKSRLKHGMGDVDEAIEEARRRLERSLAELRRRRLNVTGDIGDADPNLAITDALALFPADEVIISTHPKERSAWLERDVVERARSEIDRPITHVVVDLEAESGEPTLKGVRAVEPAPLAAREREEEEEGVAYFPPLDLRERITLVVALVGTVVLGVLAIECGVSGEGCAARILIAIGAFMVSVWHGVALIFFRSAGYRGPWARFASETVLFGIPPAILVSVLVG